MNQKTYTIVTKFAELCHGNLGSQRSSDAFNQLWEIDENLMRAELTPTQMAEHLAKRKELWGMRGSGASCPTGGGAPGENKGFAQETEETTGVDKRSINRAVSRAEGVTDPIKTSHLIVPVYLR